MNPGTSNSAAAKPIEGSEAVPLTATTQSNVEPTLGERFPLSILLAEDNPINAQLLLRVLKKNGYQADHAQNGIEAVKMASEKRYEMIFMDLQMPMMDGLEATRAILAQLSEEYHPFITAYSANTSTEDRNSCKEVGMHEFIPKPAKYQKVLEVLEEAYHWAKGTAAQKTI